MRHQYKWAGQDERERNRAPNTGIEEQHVEGLFGLEEMSYVTEQFE